MFDPSHNTPILDGVDCSFRYNFGIQQHDWDSYRDKTNGRFDAFCRLVERYIGRPLQKKITEDGEIYFYVPRYRIGLHRPNLSWGWGKIHFVEPTQFRLAALQKWLFAAFGCDLRGLISLKSIELAYDFYCPDFSRLDDYDRLAVRIGARLVANKSLYSFVVGMKNHHGRWKKCGDGALNAPVLLYVQSTRCKERLKHADNVDFNKNAAGKTKVYAKMIEHRPFIRIEHTLNKNKAKLNGIELDPNDLTRLLQLPNLPFSKFWSFKQVDLSKFISCLRINPPLKNIRSWMWSSLLSSHPLPTADVLRYLSSASIGNPYLARLKSRSINELSFNEAINLPLPDDLYISRRKKNHNKEKKGNGNQLLLDDRSIHGEEDNLPLLDDKDIPEKKNNLPLPDDRKLPANIKLQPFIHKPPRQQKSLIQSNLLSAD